MDSLVDWIIGNSSNMDFTIIVRIVVFAFIIEFIGCFFDMIGRFK